MEHHDNVGYIELQSSNTSSSYNAEPLEGDSELQVLLKDSEDESRMSFLEHSGKRQPAFPTRALALVCACSLSIGSQ